MANKILAIGLLSFMLAGASCNSSSAQKTAQVSAISMTVDSMPQIKNLQDIRIVDDKLYLTYDYIGGYGHQLFCCYTIDYTNNHLSFDKEYFQKDPIFVPITFWDDKGNLLVAERDNPYIYTVVNDSLHKTPNALISEKAHTPYKMVMEAKQAFYKAKNEYYFIGRQALSGIQAVYHSDNKDDELIVRETQRIVFDERYPSWIVNYGVFTYNYFKNCGAYAYQMFPAIQIYNFTDTTHITISTETESFNPNTLSDADVWEMNPVQYKYITSTAQYIYALYWGMMAGDMNDKHNNGTAITKILKYDWEGKLRHVYLVNKGLQGIAVTSDNHEVIGYDGKEFLLIHLE